MAYIIDKKFPLDQQKRKIIGFGFPFNAPAVFNPTYQTKDQIKANLINYILTNKGERVFNDFGANLKQFLFEAIEEGTTENVKNKIQNDIAIYFPEITINELTFDRQPDRNTINIVMNYSIQDFGINDQFNIEVS